jgi:hypothetical protein
VTNLLAKRREVTSYKYFKVYRDRNGEFFEGGAPRHLVFCEGALVKEYLSFEDASRKWPLDEMDGCRLENYLGIDSRLRS